MILGIYNNFLEIFMFFLEVLDGVKSQDFGF